MKSIKLTYYHSQLVVNVVIQAAQNTLSYGQWQTNSYQIPVLHGLRVLNGGKAECNLSWRSLQCHQNHLNGMLDSVSELVYCFIKDVYGCKLQKNSRIYGKYKNKPNRIKWNEPNKIEKTKKYSLVNGKSAFHVCDSHVQLEFIGNRNLARSDDYWLIQ